MRRGSVEKDPGTGNGSGGGTGGAGGSGGLDFPAEPLGECELGPLWGSDPGMMCPWIGLGRCYLTKKAACACLCPQDHDSVCISDFPDPSGEPVPVFCD
ncbi:MAG: hypothetical protein U0263_40380 [Polyangiaceae bacterium]